MQESLKRSMIEIFLAFTFLALWPAAADALTIAIVKTDQNITAFDETAEAFKSTVEEALGQVNYLEYNMLNDHKTTGPNVIGQLQAAKPDLVFALGNIAAYLVAKNMTDTPAIFASVLNWPKYKLKTDSMTGIAMEVPEEILLQQFKMVAPNLTKVGMIYDAASSGEIVERARKMGTDKGITINAVKGDASSDLAALLTSMAGTINGFWMHADPTVYNDRGKFLALAQSALNNRVPLMTPSDQFMDNGALMSVSWSYSNMGSQAGATAVSIIRDHASPKDIPVASPIGTMFVINTCTVADLGITLDDLVYAFADKIIQLEECRQ